MILNIPPKCAKTREPKGEQSCVSSVPIKKLMYKTLDNAYKEIKVHSCTLKLSTALHNMGAHREFKRGKEGIPKFLKT